MQNNAQRGTFKVMPIRRLLLYMKISILFLLIGLQVSAVNYGQSRINLKASNIAIADVLKTIEGKSKYRFSYSNDIIPIEKLVSVNAVNASIDEVLFKLFEGYALSWKIVKQKNVVISPLSEVILAKAEAKVKNISGKITDDKGLPVIGASVTIKGSAIGAITNSEGYYSINANQGDVLVISSVGYTPQEFVVGSSAVIDVVLIAEENKMDEIIVVGYGTQKKLNATGAVATIDAKILEDRPISRLSQGLQGAIANLNIFTTYSGGAPNATQSFNIRGYTGLGSSQGPLVVIDGVQGGDINAINPSDVESISVIKDAAAAAIYGSSAPYGVIIINTKRGKAGKPTVTYNNSFTFNTPIGMPKMLNSLEFANFYNEAGFNANPGQQYGYFDKAAIQRIQDYLTGKITTETQRNASSDTWNGWFTGNANNDWFKIFYKDVQLIQQHNINMSGGTEKSKYFVGLGYNAKPGMLRYGKDVYKRYNIRANVSSQVTNWAEVGLRTSYSKETYDAPWGGGDRTGGNWMHQIARKHPNVPLYLPDGTTFSEISDVPLMAYGGRYLENWDKPTITGEIILTPLKGWSTTINYTYDANINNNSSHKKTVYVPLPSGKESPIDWTYPNAFSRSTGFRYHQVFNAFSSYNYDLNKHNFKILGGYVRELFDNLGFGGSNTNLYTDNIPSIATTYGKTPSLSDGIGQLASEGFFGRFNYSFDDKYLLEITGRYDGTSRFLSDVRWGFYPGFSAGWNVHRENFWQNTAIGEWINTFKIRGSYGTLGDQSFGDATNQANWYPFYPALGTGAPTNANWYFSSGREARTSVPGLVNPNITWVTTSTLDFGVDLTALRNRFNITFDWYKRSATDYLGPARNLPAILGTNPPQENVSAMETKGFDLTMGWKDNIGELSYTLRATLSNYKGVITKYPNDQKLLSNWFKGKVIDDIYGYETVGYFTGDADVRNSPSQSLFYSRWGAGDIKYADLNGDNKINFGKNTADDMGDLKVIGNSTPKYQYGFFADFGWRNFDASFFLQGVAKKDIWFGSSINYFWGITGSEWQSSPFTAHRDRWTPSNTDGYFPKYYMSGENSKNMQTQTKYLQNAAYMRLKNIQIGYTLPHDILGRIGFQKLRIFALVENVFTITPLRKHSTIDPEISISDMKIYPLQRGYSFGINVTL